MLPRWLITFRAFALASAFAAAFVPIATYITDDKRDWLWIHIGVNIAAYIAVALTTIYTTVSLTQQDHNKFSVPAYWANNVVMRTWYLGVSKTWRWHVAAAVGRLGFALALAQHLHIIHQTMNDFQGILAPFYYVSHAYDYVYSPQPPIKMLPRALWQAVVLSFFILIGFACLETAFLASLSVMSSQVWQKTRQIVFVVTGRFMLILIFIGIMALAHASTQAIKGDFFHQKYGTIDHYISPEKQKVIEQLSYVSTLKHWHKLAFTWLDNGTMLAAWITRPESIVTKVSEGFKINISDALISYATYILAIIASLQLAQYLHWRREQALTTT